MGKRLRFSEHSLLIASTVLTTLSLPTEAAEAQDTAKLEIVPAIARSTAVGSVAFSPDGARVVTDNIDRTAKLWNTTTGRLRRRLDGHSPILDRKSVV